METSRLCDKCFRAASAVRAKTRSWRAHARVCSHVLSSFLHVSHSPLRPQPGPWPMVAGPPRPRAPGWIKPGCVLAAHNTTAAAAAAAERSRVTFG